MGGDPWLDAYYWLGLAFAWRGIPGARLGHLENWSRGMQAQNREGSQDRDFWGLDALHLTPAPRSIPGWHGPQAPCCVCVCAPVRVYTCLCACLCRGQRKTMSVSHSLERGFLTEPGARPAAIKCLCSPNPGRVSRHDCKHAQLFTCSRM